MSIIKVRSKGELMKAIYTEQELRNIDSAIPIEYWNGVDKSIQVDTATHVMNYNEEGMQVFGNLEDMEKIAKDRGIEVVWVTNKEFLNI